jgi:hypothetical protein
MRPSYFARAFGLVLTLASAAGLAACSGTGMQVAPSAATAQSVSHVAARGGAQAPSGRSKAIAGPVRLPGSSFPNARPDSKTVVYDSIGQVDAKGKAESNIASLGYECCSTNEFGDGVTFTQAGGRLKSVQVIMDSWACQNGGVYEDTCLTTPGAKFSWPVTLNIYELVGYPSGQPMVGALLATRTQTFNMPYRPSANDKVCTGPNLGKFLSKTDKECDHGFGFGITFHMNVPLVTLPAQAVITVAFNTSDYGQNPAGHATSCYYAGNCPYDSLNVSAWGDGALPNEGGNVDLNGAFVNYQNPNFYCTPNPYGQPPGATLALDTASPSIPCWEGYHPEIKVVTY